MSEPSPFDSVIEQLQPERKKGFGSITLLIQQASSGDPESNDLLFSAVIKQLRETASRVLHALPNPLVTDPDALISNIYERLCIRLVNEQISNRQHFFATACNHFRWILLDEMKTHRPASGVLLDGEIEDITDPETALIFKETIQIAIQSLDELDQTLRDIVNAHLFLGMTFHEIAIQYDIPRSTAHDRYIKAIEQLRKDVPEDP